MKDSALIVPVHNRRTVTLACLERLHRDGVPAWCQIVVVDDGSIDGTAEAIAKDFPAVSVLHGDGNLWWTGGIAVGMRHSLTLGVRFILWLNDDCAFRPGALTYLRATAEARRAMVGGTCLIPGSHTVVYGGLRRRGFAFDLVTYIPGAIEHCDALSGNLVCFPIALVESIGLPDAKGLPHAIGDLDYGLRASAAGWPVLVAHDATADASPNQWDNHASWLLSDIPIRTIWLSAWSKRSYGYFPTQWVFLRRHWGWRGAVHAIWQLVKRVPIMGIRCFVPQRILRRAWSRRSTAWQEEQILRTALASSPTAPAKSPHSPSPH